MDFGTSARLGTREAQGLPTLEHANWANVQPGESRDEKHLSSEAASPRTISRHFLPSPAFFIEKNAMADMQCLVNLNVLVRCLVDGTHGERWVDQLGKRNSACSSLALYPCPHGDDDEAGH